MSFSFKTSVVLPIMLDVMNDIITCRPNLILIVNPRLPKGVGALPPP